MQRETIEIQNAILRARRLVADALVQAHKDSRYIETIRGLTSLSFILVGLEYVAEDAVLMASAESHGTTFPPRGALVPPPEVPNA
jgi:hypothetical protein